MRQFLYLNTDLVNSIIAQDERGLTDAITTENEKGELEESAKRIMPEFSGELGGNIVQLAKAEATLGINGDFSSSKENHATVKEIVAKKLHDAAYDIAYSAIKPVMVDDEGTTINTGNYVEMIRQFEIIDFEYLNKMFLEDGIIEYKKRIEKETLLSELDKQINKGCNREQRRQADLKSKNKKANQLVAEINKQYEDIHNAISAIGSLIPCDRMLFSSDGYLIPLEEQFFKVTPNCFGFMYGGKIRCVGMVTNIIEKESSSSSKTNVFSTVQNAINDMISAIIPTDKDKLYVVSPIAVYYEN